MHTYIQIYIAPKIVRRNLRRWHSTFFFFFFFFFFFLLLLLLLFLLTLTAYNSTTVPSRPSRTHYKMTIGSYTLSVKRNVPSKIYRIDAINAANLCSNRSISPARRAHNSKPAADRTDGQTDGRTDTVAFQMPASAYYAGRAKNIKLLPKCLQERQLMWRAAVDCFRCSNSSSSWDWKAQPSTIQRFTRG